MKQFLHFSKTLLVLLIITSVFLIYLSCNTKNADAGKGLKNATGDVYAGSVVCSKCHADVYNNFIHTAHFLTSSVPNKKSIKGSFDQGKNYFVYNYFMAVVMQMNNNGYFQIEYEDGKQKEAQRFYLVIGSGTRGQSYLYLKDSQLYQLPVSYFTSSNSWANSPGFPFYEPMFKRTIQARCLECHATYANMSSLSKTDESGNSENIIFGVTCENCHGAAEKHVEFEEQHPEIKKAEFIINPSKLTRQQKIDMCSYCHSNGIRKQNKPAFSFKPGDSLNKYLVIDTAKLDPNKIDVHGNQAALLTKSKCFKMSSLDCTTCHDTHKQERGNVQLFSQRCMNCHNTEHKSFCKLTSVSTSVLMNNCIDCHMPQKQSKTLTVNLTESQKTTPAILRSHLIAVYPDETKSFLMKLAANKKSNN